MKQIYINSFELELDTEHQLAGMFVIVAQDLEEFTGLMIELLWVEIPKTWMPTREKLFAKLRSVEMFEEVKWWGTEEGGCCVYNLKDEVISRVVHYADSSSFEDK